MTYWEDLWSGTALVQYEALPLAARDQVDACVREIRRDPHVAGEELPVQMSRPLYGAQAGLVNVVYQIDEIGESVYILRVVNRG